MHSNAFLWESMPKARKSGTISEGSLIIRILFPMEISLYSILYLLYKRINVLRKLYTIKYIYSNCQESYFFFLRCFNNSNVAGISEITIIANITNVKFRFIIGIFPK